MAATSPVEETAGDAEMKSFVSIDVVAGSFEI